MENMDRVGEEAGRESGYINLDSPRITVWLGLVVMVPAVDTKQPTHGLPSKCQDQHTARSVSHMLGAAAAAGPWTTF